jgi:nuclear transport factor 2 (NTF2) superfamily protein
LIMDQKLPVPPFTQETAKQMIQLVEDIWNSQDPEKVANACSIDTEWRARTVFVSGRENIAPFLAIKWKNELGYKIVNEYWAHTENKVAIRFEYEYHNAAGEWFRAYGNEDLAFDEHGLMTRRYVSINDLPIAASERKL